MAGGSAREVIMDLLLPVVSKYIQTVTIPHHRVPPALSDTAVKSSRDSNWASLGLQFSGTRLHWDCDYLGLGFTGTVIS